MKLRSRGKGAARLVPFAMTAARMGPLSLAVAAFALFSISAVSPAAMEGLRTRAGDVFAPALATINAPFQYAADYVRAMTGIAALQAENARLAQENARLREWYQTALSLQAQNDELKNLLNVKLEPHSRFVTARVVADAGSAFARSLLVLAGDNDGVAAGQAVLAGDGLVGRIIESGRNTARVLLVTDVNSRIPVLVEGAGQRAILAGQNDDRPVLLHLPPEFAPEEGARVVTSGDGGIFPYGLPVGIVAKRADGGVFVRPFAAADRINMVRIVARKDDPNLIPATDAREEGR